MPTDLGQRQSPKRQDATLGGGSLGTASSSHLKGFFGKGRTETTIYAKLRWANSKPGVISGVSC